MSWCADFSKLPKTGRVIVQYENGSQRMGRVEAVISDGMDPHLAWCPAPEPYAPSKPEQISFAEADRLVILHKAPQAHNAGRLDAHYALQQLLEAVEKRTREIVAWEQKHGGDK